MIIISSPRAVRDLLDKRGAITGGRPRSHMQRAHSGLHMVLEDMGNHPSCFILKSNDCRLPKHIYRDVRVEKRPKGDLSLPHT